MEASNSSSSAMGAARATVVTGVAIVPVALDAAEVAIAPPAAGAAEAVTLVDSKDE